jgi:hypothetical protein
MDYKTKYLKYKTKYLNLSRKIQSGGVLTDEKRQKIIQKIKIGIKHHNYLSSLLSFLCNNSGIDSQMNAIEKIALIEGDEISVADILNTIGELPYNINMTELSAEHLTKKYDGIIHPPIHFHNQIFNGNTGSEMNYILYNLEKINENIRNIDIRLSQLKKYRESDKITEIEKQLEAYKKKLEKNIPESMINFQNLSTTEEVTPTSLSIYEKINLHKLFKKACDFFKDDKYKVYDSIFDENGHFKADLSLIKPATIYTRQPSEYDE